MHGHKNKNEEIDYLQLRGFRLDPNDNESLYWTVSVIITVLLILGFIILVFFLERTHQLLKLIKSPQQGSTYCILTTCIIRSLQLLLIFSMIVQFLRIIFVCMGNNYEELILQRMSTFWIYYIYQICVQFIFPVTDLTYLMQTIEWIHVIFIIR